MRLTEPHRVIDGLGHLFPRAWTLARRLLEGRTVGDRACLKETFAAHPGPWLDVGCGTGRYAGLYPPAHYLGIDIDARRLAVARRRHPDHRFECTTTTELLKDGRRYQGLVLAQVLHHLSTDEVDRILGECDGLLEPAGLLVLIEWCPRGPGAPWAHNLWHRFEDGSRTLDAGHWKARLSDQGFTEVRERPIINHRFHLAMLTALRSVAKKQPLFSGPGMATKDEGAGS